MALGMRLRVWGPRACFTRPEFKIERQSYLAPTPSAARGILEAIHWKPAIHYVIDRIHVLAPIRTQSFRRNEVGVKASTALASRAMKSRNLAGLGIDVAEQRQQRSTTLLLDVEYVIEAHFELTGKVEGEDAAKHISMFNRRAQAGQCFHRPCLGTREFAADFELIPPGAPLPQSRLPDRDRDRDLGWMLYDLDFSDPANVVSRFYRARMEGGVIDVARCLAEGTAA